jgi:hypothetical protein
MDRLGEGKLLASSASENRTPPRLCAAPRRGFDFAVAMVTTDPDLALTPVKSTNDRLTVFALLPLLLPIALIFQAPDNRASAATSTADAIRNPIERTASAR